MKPFHKFLDSRNLFKQNFDKIRFQSKKDIFEKVNENDLM